ncbi:hypothetical protein TorRG33x02_314180 [Trema orientale]|uniref:Uncharacterized protein n=1 Tax=Trema orientale TaxID=63057 RepID=A0A2P5BNX6_TREOI|nr:hypothetical protein TorRG33x02_314180 [Trema orientale]
MEGIELEEDVEGPVAVGLGEGLGVIRKKVEEVVERGVEGTGAEDAALEVEAEVGGVLAVVEVVGDEGGEGVGLGATKGLLDGIAVRLKEGVQVQVQVQVQIQIQDRGCGCFVFPEDVNLNGGAYLFVGVGLDGEGVLASDIGRRRLSLTASCALCVVIAE